MKKAFQILLGANGSSVVRGLRFGAREFLYACHASHAAVRPLEPRGDPGQGRARDALNHIPAVPVGQLVDGVLGGRNAMLNLDLSPFEDGRLPIHEALALLALLVAENPAEVLEIGTYMGHTTKAMAKNLPNAIVHTVDLPQDLGEPENSGSDIPKDDFHLIRRRVVGREFKGQPLEARIRQHFGDTAKIDFQEFGHPSFFFIDGSHTYEYCKQDSEKCLALCRGTGTFLWHDCDDHHPGVVRFVTEWRAMGRDLCRISGTSLAYWKIGT